MKFFQSSAFNLHHQHCNFPSLGVPDQEIIRLNCDLPSMALAVCKHHAIHFVTAAIQILLLLFLKHYQLCFGQLVLSALPSLGEIQRQQCPIRRLSDNPLFHCLPRTSSGTQGKLWLMLVLTWMSNKENYTILTFPIF